MVSIDATNLHYRELNRLVRQAVEAGENEIVLNNVNGHRYIGAGLSKGPGKDELHIIVDGTPGNDLGSFLDGPSIEVFGNAQDGVGNTMNSGKVVIWGNAGDIVGHSMRGGKIFVRGNVGYRVGIHMKSYGDLRPLIIVGGKTGGFLGEYMAGGIIIVLGLPWSSGTGVPPIIRGTSALPCTNVSSVGDSIGTGMHGGLIYVRGEVSQYQLGREVMAYEVEEGERELLAQYLSEYCETFSLDLRGILASRFQKLVPRDHRPYGTMYAHS